MAYFGSMKEPKAPAKRMRVDVVDALLFHQQLDAGIKRGLGELDGAHVVLGDGDLRLAVASADRTRCGRSGMMRGLRAASAPSTTPSSEMMPERYISATTSMMAGAADAGDAGCLRPLPRSPSSSDHLLDADDAVLRLQRVRVDAHALDGARRGALAARRFRRPRRPVRSARRQATTRWRLPSTISALVPTSTSSIILSWRYGPSDSVAPAASAPTWPAMQGSM